MPRNTKAIVYKRRLEPVLDEYVHASINAVQGKHDEHGHYATLVYAGCQTKERAEEIKRALHRCAYYLFTHGGPQVSMSAKIVKSTDESGAEVFNVEFKAIDKAHARAYMVQKYGPDMEKWPYSPRKGFKNFDEAGNSAPSTN